MGQLTCHAWISGQNTSCVCTVVSHFAKFKVVVVFFYENLSQSPVSLSNFVIVLIYNGNSFMIIQFC